MYILYISVDANFKLKGKERGLKDIELMPGWGPFVEESEYQGFIAGYVDQPEVITTLFFCPILRAERLLSRSIPVNRSMMPLSGLRLGVRLVMPSRALVLSSARGMDLYDGMGPVTSKKARGTYV